MYANNCCSSLDLGGLGALGSYDDNGNWTDDSTIYHIPGSSGGGGGVDWGRVTANLITNISDTASKIAIIGAIPANTAITPTGIYRSNTGVIPGLPNIGTGLNSTSLLMIGGALALVLILKR